MMIIAGVRTTLSIVMSEIDYTESKRRNPQFPSHFQSSSQDAEAVASGL